MEFFISTKASYKKTQKDKSGFGNINSLKKNKTKTKKELKGSFFMQKTMQYLT